MSGVKWVDFFINPDCRISAKTALIQAIADCGANVTHEDFLETLYRGGTLQVIADGITHALRSELCGDGMSCRFLAARHNTRGKPPKTFFRKLCTRVHAK